MSITLGELIYEIGLKDGDFQKKLKGLDSKMGAVAKVAEQTGKKLTTNLTLPIVGLGTAALKLAADFEVSSRKFSKAFEGAGNEAAASVELLNEEFGIAESQATQLLGFTGDLLKGFGATSNEALVLAESTNILAASLSAYNGVPVAQSSEAVTKALLGERESLKQLGVVISEEAVKKQLLADGTAELTGQELLLAKANATLTLAYEQSSDAVASFNENTDTAAFMTQALIGDMKDLAVQFGTILLPVLKDVLAEVSTLVEDFSELDDETKANIIQTLALVAALGPAVVAFGNVVKVVKGLTAAMAFLAANPLVAAITALGAMSVAMGVIIKQAEEKRVEDLTNQFEELATQTGVAAENMEEFVNNAADVENVLMFGDVGSSLSETSSLVKAIAKDFGITKEQVLAIGLASKDLSKELKGNLQTIENERAETEGQLQLKRDIVKEQGKSRKAAEDIADSEEVITAELIAQKKLREDIEDKYQAAFKDFKDIIKTEKLESELLKDQIDQYTKLVDGSDAYNKAREDALEILTKKYNEALEVERKETEKHYDDLIEKAFKQEETVNKLKQDFIEKNIAAEKKAADEKLKITQDTINDILTGIETGFNLLSDLTTATSDEMDDVFSGIGDMLINIALQTGNAYIAAAGIAIKAITAIIDFNQEREKADKEYAQKKIEIANDIAEEEFKIRKAEIDREYDLEIEALNKLEDEKLKAYQDTLTEKEVMALKAAGILEETELERIDRELKAAIEADDQEQINLLENEKEIEKIRAEIDAARIQAENDYKNQIAKFNYDKAVFDKAVQLQQIEINKASAISELSWWDINVDHKDRDIKRLFNQLSSTVSGFTIPEPVYLANGGIAPATPGGIPAIIGEAGSPEAVIPLNDAFFNRLAMAAKGSTMGGIGDSSRGGGMMQNNIILDGRMIGQNTVELINNRVYTIDARSVRS